MIFMICSHCDELCEMAIVCEGSNFCLKCSATEIVNCNICQDQVCKTCADICIFCRKLKCDSCICACDAKCETCWEKYNRKMIYSCTTCHDLKCSCTELTCIHKKFTCCRCNCGHKRSELKVYGLHGI
jgi:hypothetical protein